MKRMTRRSWLAGTTLVLGFRGHPLAAREHFGTFSFIVVSDTHLGRQDSDSARRQWATAIEEINRTPAEFILHLGDVVDNGRPAQYPIYADLRGRLNKPIHEIPGNHDPLELFEKHVASPIDRAFDHGGVRFLLFGNAHTDSHDGFITAEQLNWIESQCEDAKARDLHVIAACHVPLHKNQHPDRGWYVKPEHGQTTFYDIVDRYADRFLACFHGHFHNGIRGWRDHGTTVEVLFPSVCYNQDRHLQEAIRQRQAEGFFVEELRPGYVLVTLSRDHMKLQYKPLNAGTSEAYEARW